MDVDRFIERWRSGPGGQERANYAMFLLELCDVLGVPRPDQAGSDRTANDYVFERAVTFAGIDGPEGHGRIDLYRRGRFVCECKQSRRADGDKRAERLADQLAFDGLPAPDRGGRVEARWDALMKAARYQAARYARALPADHPPPPFLIVCDIGRCLELYADFTGTGRHYELFPDRKRYRIFLDDLLDPAIREMLRLVWEDPHALDPSREAAKVTREIAGRLAKVSRAIEAAEGVAAMAPAARAAHAERIALFLMRVIFSMFAEDVELLPKGSLSSLLERCKDQPDHLVRYLPELWQRMAGGADRFSLAIGADVKHFNGGLFEDTRVFALPREELGELIAAASADWRTVEPAIFGTLLEQALDPDDRAALGAHYTPRAYVETLVNATIIEPLRARWQATQAAIEAARADGGDTEALRIARAFLAELTAIRVLDPACGTGNFLYVSLLLLKRLEAEVREAILDLRGGEEFAVAAGETIDPHNFLGLEKNGRAAAIAELVLWIGYLQWHYANASGAPAEPILRRFGNINFGEHRGGYDAVLAQGTDGAPDLGFPRRPAWPEADYIVGNPPFIGGKDLRERLGGDYAEALWKAHPKMPKAADFVMYWWDRAADILQAKGTRLKRFGFVTTNSITQALSRKVIQARMAGRVPISLVMAIPNHPWTKATKGAAAVRIAMTVAELGEVEGLLRTVSREAGLDTDEPRIDFREAQGTINADLSIGADITATVALRANAQICHDGVKLHGAGFIVTANEAAHLGLGRREGLDQVIRPYRNGKDLAAKSRNRLVIDLFGFDEVDVRRRFPEVWQHLHSTVREDRRRQFERSPTKDSQAYFENWWIFGKPRTELRPALVGLSRFIATVDTARHRLFQFLPADYVCDDKSVLVADDSAAMLGILSSKLHVIWATRAGGWLGAGNDPVYTKSRVFDPFPFPDASDAQRAAIAALAEELDATRKAALAEHPDLTMTGLYNVRAKLAAGEPLTAADRDVLHRGRVAIISERHDRLDAAVAAAYGWPADLAADEIVARLVALNAERAAEERAGRVRWLRPDYQLARAGVTVLGEAAEAAPGLALPAAAAALPALPRDYYGRAAAVTAALAVHPGPVTAEALAAGFKGGRATLRAIETVLDAAARVGAVAKTPHGWRLTRAA